MSREPRGAASQPPITAAHGQRYVIERALGQGGMGAVYAVFDRSKAKRLALKRLNAGAGKHAAAMFDREYRILSSLRHPCIVEVYDYGLDEEGAYYTMELVEGRELSSRAPVPWRAACSYMRDAASILGLLHAHRLLHRDLSPRNLIETTNGRLKLIDFGTLADFGKASEVAGTPPFVAPEALRSGLLDQRSDLFAVGAFGYWLVTGSHAFPARSLAELPAQWQREPRPASVCVRALRRADLEVPPPELDNVLSLLLRIDAHERIASTSELIDRLNMIAELAPEDTTEAVQGYLQSKVFVGRERDMDRVVDAVKAARVGRGQVVLIEGDSGMGRSHFLQEVALLTRVEGALTLSADSTGGPRPYALAQTLLAQLQRELRDQLRPYIEPHAAILGPLSPLAASPLAPPPEASSGAVRARLQTALVEIFLGVARSHFLSIVVDDLQHADAESFAFLTALSHAAPRCSLCIVASLAEHAQKELAATVAVLRSLAVCLRMRPLTAPEIRRLLGSMFGEVPYLDRLSERLHRSSEGNPAYCVELARHLVHEGAARYVEGRWMLPMELSPESLPANRRAGLLSRLERLPPAALAIASAISVPHRMVWTTALAARAANVPEAEAAALIARLAFDGILRAREDGFAFNHDEVRDKLCGDLDPTARAEIHSRVAQALEDRAEAADVALTLCACIHRLRAGQLDFAFRSLKAALHRCLYGDPAFIGVQASAFEEIVNLLMSLGQDDYALCGPLCSESPGISPTAGMRSATGNRRFARSITC